MATWFAPAPSTAATPRPLRVGISYGSRLSGMSSTALAATLDDAVAIGASWVRDDLSWARVEAVKGRYDWAAFDAVVAAAKQRHLQVLPILHFTPAWARPAA